MIVVQTRISYSPATKRVITSSSLFSDICPCPTAIRDPPNLDLIPRPIAAVDTGPGSITPDTDFTNTCNRNSNNAIQ